MRLFPYEKYYLKTKLTPDEVIQRLSDSIEPRKYFTPGFLRTSSSKEYEGVILKDTFHINKIPILDPVFSLRIFGAVKRTTTGSLLYIKIELNPRLLAVTA